MSGVPDDSASTQLAEPIHRLLLRGADLEVVSGPDEGARARVGHEGLVIGSGGRADLRLDDSLISRQHVRLRADRAGVQCEDLDSRNGTRIGGMAVRNVTLFRDTFIELGETTLALRLLEEPLDLPLSLATEFGEAIGHSPAMRYVFALLERAAQNDATVLLEGDSGTGKDVLATALHSESRRADGPFVVVDCGALPRDLVESELFGHEQGAFSGAVGQRKGAFELAHGGTVFLDEIGELPLEVQPKLLRVLENRSFRRIGGSRPVDVDVRVVAATNRRLRQAVRGGSFREDLYYRLAVISVWIPPLSERRGDIAPIAEALFRRVTGDVAATLPVDLERLLSSYHFPGNARELRNVVERYATFRQADARLLFSHHQGPTGRAGSAPPAVAPAAGDEASEVFSELAGLPYHEAKRRALEQFQKDFLIAAVTRANGSVPAAAKALGLRKTSLYRMLSAMGWSPE